MVVSQLNASFAVYIYFIRRLSFFISFIHSFFLSFFWVRSNCNKLKTPDQCPRKRRQYWVHGAKNVQVQNCSADKIEMNVYIWFLRKGSRLPFANIGGVSTWRLDIALKQAAMSDCPCLLLVKISMSIPNNLTSPRINQHHPTFSCPVKHSPACSRHAQPQPPTQCANADWWLYKAKKTELFISFGTKCSTGILYRLFLPSFIRQYKPTMHV